MSVVFILVRISRFAQSYTFADNNDAGFKVLPDSPVYIIYSKM